MFSLVNSPPGTWNVVFSLVNKGFLLFFVVSSVKNVCSCLKNGQCKFCFVPKKVLFVFEK